MKPATEGIADKRTGIFEAFRDGVYRVPTQMSIKSWRYDLFPRRMSRWSFELSIFLWMLSVQRLA
jgi:hypothetical protein